MSTPIGHSLAGIALSRLTSSSAATPGYRWYAFGIVAANAADLDFLPGLLTGNINLYHQGLTHSIFFALVFGLVSAIFISKWLHYRPLPVAAAGILFYCSHLILDYFRADAREPFGIPLFWPLSDQHWISSKQVFHGIKHGVPGDNLTVFFSQLFSHTNLIAVGIEIIILLPILFSVVYITRRKSTAKKNARNAAPVK